jgi:protocatechuate 3,4-dioxygenase beta subunit
MSHRDRRDVLTGLAALPLVPLLACAREPAAAAAGKLIAGATCPVTPRQTEGPFYFDPKLVRRDVREGRPGLPLRLRLQVVEAAACAPVAGARVDIWHCDSAGAYSGYDGERSAGQAWLRGTQFADANGIVLFETLYPGWYGGRATHIHCKAWLPEGRGEIASQIYFPDALSDSIYAEAPYAGRSGRRLRNAVDGIFGADSPLAEAKRGPNGVDAALVLALR